MKKRIFSMLLVIVMVLSLLPTAALADDVAPGDSGEKSTVTVQLMLKAVDAADNNEISGDLDALLNGSENTWVGTYGAGEYDCNVGENTLSGWDLCPEGYMKPTEDITFTVGEDGSITITSSNATVETTNDGVHCIVVPLTACTHSDEDIDHWCDGCDAHLSALCCDDDNDHCCDTCGIHLSNLYIDSNKDHQCDDCGELMSGCEDTVADDGSRDFKCDICGNWMLPAVYVTAKAGDKQITVTWDALTEVEAVYSGLTYSVTALDENGVQSTGTPTYNSDSGTYTCTITGLTNDVTYDVSVNVTHTGWDGYSIDSSAEATPYAAGATAPAEPTNVTVKPGYNQLTVTWEAPENNGGAKILYYVIEYAPEGAEDEDVGTYVVDGGETSVTLMGLKEKTTYEIKVSAQNAVGSGACSAVAEGTTLDVEFGTAAVEIYEDGILPGNEEQLAAASDNSYAGDEDGYITTTLDGGAKVAINRAYRPVYEAYANEGVEIFNPLVGLDESLTVEYSVEYEGMNTDDPNALVPARIDNQGTLELGDVNEDTTVTVVAEIYNEFGDTLGTASYTLKVLDIVYTVTIDDCTIEYGSELLDQIYPVTFTTNSGYVTPLIGTAVEPYADGYTPASPVGSTFTIGLKKQSEGDIDTYDLTDTATLTVVNCPSLAFSDLNTSLWYHSATDYVLSKGLMNGVGGYKFDPNGTTTRAMAVTILWRMAGCLEPKTDSQTDFDDVEADQWYTKAVRWAASEEIVLGYGNGKFGPTDAVTREQMVTMLMRFAAYQQKDTAPRAELTDFKDYEKVSSYAVASMQWAVEYGIIEGYPEDGTIRPQGSTTRVEVAKIVHVYCQVATEQ